MGTLWEKISKSWASTAAPFAEVVNSSFDETAAQTSANVNVGEPFKSQRAETPQLPRVVSFRTKRRRNESGELKVGVFGEDGHLLLTAYSYVQGSRGATIIREDGKKDRAALSSTGLFEYELRHAGHVFCLSKEKGHKRGGLGHIHRLLEPYGWNYETSFMNLTRANGEAEIECDGLTLFKLNRHEYYEMGCDSEITVDYSRDYAGGYWPVVLTALSMSGIVDTDDPDDDYIPDC